MVIRQGMKAKSATRIVAIALLIAIALTISACGNEKNNENLIQETNLETVSNITEPTLVVKGTAVKAGSENIEVVIEIRNNPGILGMDFDLYYDDSVMILTDSKSLLDLKGCHYTSPSYYRNPTSFLWDFQDANWVEDGTVLKLYFDILETAPLGEYEIKVMYSYGNIFDANGAPIDIKVKNAYITVEE